MEMQRGFSIREYASKMRSVNVANSWPFDEAAGEETVKSLLPPINVKKFTWWLDQLAESATNNNNVVGMSENKKKTKAAPPKKRSIVEIFAVAPPVERAASEAEEEEEEEGGSFFEEDASFIKWGPKGKRNDKRRKIISKKSDANAIFKKIKKLKPKHRGILRNYAKQFSKKNISHEGDKHVTFSDKNDTRSGKQSSNYHSQCSNKLLRKDSTAIIEDVLSMGIEKGEVDAGFTTFIMKRKYDDEESVSRSESSDRSTLLSMNRNLSESGLAEVTHDSLMYACPDIDSTSRDLIRNLDSVIFPPPMSFKSNNESLVSRPNFSHANNSAFRFQTLPRQHPFCGNIHAKTGVNRLNNQDFVGLPLNSQGEFISFNPCANSSVDLFSERRRLDCGTSSTNRLNIFPDESYVINQNPLLVNNPSRLDITKSPCDNEANFGFDFLKINEHAFQDSDNNTVNKSLGNEKIQSTMRLMGKEFAVGGRAFQESENGHIWKDKKIVNEHRFGNIPFSNFMVHDHKFRETLLFRPSENTHTGVFASRKIDSVQKTYPRSEYYNRESLFSNKPKAAQNLTPISAIRFPFMHPDIQGNTKSYSRQRSSSNRVPFRFDASKNVNRNYAFSHLHKSTNNVPFKPIKMPTFGFRNVGSSARFEGSVRNTGRAYEPCAATNRTTEFDNATVGPIKLTAGAKHMLKACQKKDKQFISSRFADSDISLSGTTTDFRFP